MQRLGQADYSLLFGNQQQVIEQEQISFLCLQALQTDIHNIKTF